MYHPYFRFTTTAVIVANVYAFTIMRLSQLDLETPTLQSATYAEGGTISSTLNSATIMRSSSLNAEANMTNAALNRSVEML